VKPDALILAACGAITIVNAISAWLLWGLRKEFASKAEVGMLATRITEIESAQENAPTVTGVHEIALAVERLTGEVRAQRESLSGGDGRMNRIERTVERIEEHLLNK
jgi:hypothetical protein